MDASLIARLGLSRLRLPIPGAKWLVVNSIAHALREEATQGTVWEDLIRWISTMDFESEIVEALTIAVLAKDAPIVSTAALQAAIHKPSPLSDIFLQEVSGRPLMVNSWTTAHSGEVIPVFIGTDEIEQLKQGRIVPPILRHRLLDLEQRSGRPFMKQWAFEFRALSDRIGQQLDGYWQYFCDDVDREDATGQFITRRGHLARSAYLRTLALAADVWNMPIEVAYREAMHASPADLSFLGAPPSSSPLWAAELRNKAPVTEAEWRDVAVETCERVKQSASAELLHVNARVATTDKYQAELEIISLLQDKTPIPADEVFHFHDSLPGKIELERTHNWRIHMVPDFVDTSLRADGGAAFRPALLPAVTRFAGYFQFDLWKRMPYLPANYSAVGANLMAEPRQGGMDLRLDDRLCGQLTIWHDRWGPTHHREMGSRYGVGLTLASHQLTDIVCVPGLRLRKYWRATMMRRERSFSSWSVQRLSGELP